MKNTDAYKSYSRWRKYFVLKLILFHFALILLFDSLAIFFPHIMTRSIGMDSVFTLGIVFALGIVTSVIFSTFYYTHRINQEETDLADASK